MKPCPSLWEAQKELELTELLICLLELVVSSLNLFKINYPTEFEAKLR